MAAAVLREDHLDAEPIATVEGELSTLGGEWSVRLEVVQVVADETGTDLTYILRSLDGELSDGDRSAWGDGQNIYNDTRSIALIDPSTGARLLPYTGYLSRSENWQSDSFCACSDMPYSVGRGDTLSALLPPLSPGVTSVTLEFPGLPPVTDVPVAWR